MKTYIKARDLDTNPQLDAGAGAGADARAQGRNPCQGWGNAPCRVEAMGNRSV